MRPAFRRGDGAEQQRGPRWAALTRQRHSGSRCSVFSGRASFGLQMWPGPGEQAADVCSVSVRSCRAQLQRPGPEAGPGLPAPFGLGALSSTPESQPTDPWAKRGSRFAKAQTQKSAEPNGTLTVEEGTEARDLPGPQKPDRQETHRSRGSGAPRTTSNFRVGQTPSSPHPTGSQTHTTR